MRWTSALSINESAKDAVSEALALIAVEHGADVPDLVIAFTSGFDGEDLQRISDALTDAWPRAVLIGCTAEGVVASQREVERHAGLSLMVGTLPDVTLSTFSADAEQLASPTWGQGLVPEAADDPFFIVCGDPFTTDPKRFFAAIEAACPGAPVIGGFASMASEPGGNTLFFNGELHTEGVVGLALTGAIQADIVLSQGCRPIGDYRVVTQAEGRWVHGLRNEPALKVLEQLAHSLPTEDRDLMAEGLFLGRAIDPTQSSFDRGDFLITTVLGGDPENGALAIAGGVRPGTTVQFHVREGRPSVRPSGA